MLRPYLVLIKDRNEVSLRNSVYERGEVDYEMVLPIELVARQLLVALNSSKFDSAA